MGHPKEAEKEDRVQVFGHVARTEDDQSEADDEDVDDKVRLTDVLLLDHGRFVGDGVKGKKDAEKGDDGQDLTGDVHEEHRATDDYVEEQALEGP